MKLLLEIAVVAEWLRRLTRNQIPSGSVGSNPTDCEENFFSSPAPPASGAFDECYGATCFRAKRDKESLEKHFCGKSGLSN